MSLSERLRQIRDSFSTRHGVHGPGYKPDEISAKLRRRILLLYSEIITGRMTTHPGVVAPQDNSFAFFEQMHQSLRLLYGNPKLSKGPAADPNHDVLNFTGECSASEFFDFIEARFKLEISWRIFHDENVFVDALNDVFRMESSPYEITYGSRREEMSPTQTGPSANRMMTVRVSSPRVVRVDEEVAHQEAVLPALSALSDPANAGADDEFRKALRDYRNGDYEDCLGKCGSAFESVLKVLCDKNRLAYDEQKDTAGPLLDKVLAKSALDTDTFKDRLFVVGRLRNRLSSSHGGGAQVRKVERHVAQYAVTSTAAAIVLLVQDMGK